VSKGSTQTSTSSVPQWQSQAFQQLLGNSTAQTSQDLSLADAPGVVNQISNSTQGILGQQQNGTALAAPITAAGSSAWTNPGTASSYMSPYENTALASQVNLDQQSLLNPELAGAASSEAASGALGGDRSAVLQSNLTNNFNNTEANTIAQGENTAYTTGENAYEADAARNLAGQEAGANTQLQTAGTNIYANSAATQNGLAGIAAAESPEQQYATQAGILATAPKQGTTQTTETPNGGALGGILGGVLGGAGQLLTGISNIQKVAHGGPINLKKKKTRRLKKRKK
jgi:hypothetical protein